jgi:wobble nucleotide-excising tRNase
LANSQHAHRIRQNDLGETPVRQHQDKILTENSTKARDQAETAFSRTQTQFMARSRTISEIDAVVAERDAKTLRLRELRLEKEAAAALNAATPKKPAKR